MNINRFLSVGLLCFCLSSCWTTQEGQKHGVLVKVAKEGTFWGTYEAELIRGGFSDGTGANGHVFKATLGQLKSNLVMMAIDFMDHQTPVTINYHCEEFVAPWRGEHNCFIDQIKGKK